MSALGPVNPSGYYRKRHRSQAASDYESIDSQTVLGETPRRQKKMFSYGDTLKTAQIEMEVGEQHAWVSDVATMGGEASEIFAGMSFILDETVWQASRKAARETFIRHNGGTIISNWPSKHRIDPLFLLVPYPIDELPPNSGRGARLAHGLGERGRLYTGVTRASSAWVSACREAGRIVEREDVLGIFGKRQATISDGSRANTQSKDKHRKVQDLDGATILQQARLFRILLHIDEYFPGTTTSRTRFYQLNDEREAARGEVFLGKKLPQTRSFCGLYQPVIEECSPAWARAGRGQKDVKDKRAPVASGTSANTSPKQPSASSATPKVMPKSKKDSENRDRFIFEERSAKVIPVKSSTDTVMMQKAPPKSTTPTAIGQDPDALLLIGLRNGMTQGVSTSAPAQGSAAIAHASAGPSRLVQIAKPAITQETQRQVPVPDEEGLVDTGFTSFQDPGDGWKPQPYLDPNLVADCFETDDSFQSTHPGEPPDLTTNITAQAEIDARKLLEDFSTSARDTEYDSLLPFARYYLDTQSTRIPDIDQTVDLLNTIGLVLSDPAAYYAPANFLRVYSELVDAGGDFPTFSDVLKATRSDRLKVDDERGLPDSTSRIMTPCVLVDNISLVEIDMKYQRATVHFIDSAESPYMQIIQDSVECFAVDMIEKAGKEFDFRYETGEPLRATEDPWKTLCRLISTLELGLKAPKRHQGSLSSSTICHSACICAAGTLAALKEWSRNNT